MKKKGGVLFSENTSNKFSINDITTPVITIRQDITTAVRGLLQGNTITITLISDHSLVKEIT